MNIPIRNSLNELGQIANTATLNIGDQVVSRWTPDLHWRATFSSTWDTTARWTLGLNPAHVHDVFIDPAASLTVTGPATDTTVRSLQIGGGSGLATLALRNGAVLTSTNGVTIASTGTFSGDGSIAGNVINNGQRPHPYQCRQQCRREDSGVKWKQSLAVRSFIKQFRLD